MAENSSGDGHVPGHGQGEVQTIRLSDMISAEVSKAVQLTTSKFLGQIDTMLETKIGSVKQDIIQTQKRSASEQVSEMKRLKSSVDQAYTFKKKGNERQYKFNTGILQHIEEAKEAIEEGQPDQATEKLDNGTKELKTRQKHILLADKSESGWRVVEEYIQDDLASDSDDEDRIRKSENRAAAKMKRQRGRGAFTARGRGRGGFGGRGFPTAPIMPVPGMGAISTGFGGQNLASGRGRITGNHGNCFACGKAGHYRSGCPDLFKQRAAMGAALGPPDQIISVIQSSKTWRELEGISQQDGELGALFQKMPCLSRSSRALSTGRAYDMAFRKWASFACSKDFVSLPADPLQFSFFLCKLIDEQVGLNSVQAIFYGVKWFHDMANEPSPTDHSFVKNLFESAKRCLSRPISHKKDVVTLTHLQELCMLYNNSKDLTHVRDICMMLLGFSGFLRFNELSQIKCSELFIAHDHVRINIPKSKTDQLRKGSEVVKSRSGKLTCPVRWLEKYCELAQIQLDSNVYLFSPIFKSRDRQGLVGENKALSYTACKENIVGKLRTVGNGNFGLHSLRSGGASRGVSKGVTGVSLKRHGRWKTDAAKDMYLENSLQERLEVTKKLGL